MSGSEAAVMVDGFSQRVAAYVHIPFCRRVCPYCDFAVTSDRSLVDRYLDAVIVEIDRSEPFGRPLDAVAFGGGTPTAVEPERIGEILAALGGRFGVAVDAEVSIEANPEDITSRMPTSLADVGITRISLGVQSFDDDVLVDLGRVHSASEAVQAVESAKAAFPSVNVDLIYGSPAESDESWRLSVEQAVALDTQHLSLYALTVERGTPLSRSVTAGAPAPDSDIQTDRWEVGVGLAEESGLVRYETSNLARPGHEVAYNLITWGQGDYAAFGVGAHGHRSGRRSWNVRRVDRYVERVEAGESPESGHEVISGWESDVERVMLGLRRAAGVRSGCAGQALLDSSSGARLVEAGVLAVRGDRLVVARPMLTDEVVRTLLALESRDC